MDRFPTVERLAAAPLERVLELWSGLGYYRRARLMHLSAQRIVARFNGEFPADCELARTLPGVGDYTARAVLSIAYQKPLFVLDGNVARVISRLRAMKGNLHQTSFRRAVEASLQPLLSRRRPGDFNQAIMQLGQLVCLPRAPRCEICPLRRKCEANLLGAPEEFPEPRPRRASEVRFLAVAVFRRNGKVALVRGLDDGLLGDLWNFPAAFGRSRTHARAVLVQKLGSLFPVKVRLGRRMIALTHNITHRAIRADTYPAGLTRNGQETSGSFTTQEREEGLPGDGWGNSLRWLSPAGFPRAAVSRLARKIATMLPILHA
jgi:A/G-specific adenine glycosylase